MIQVAGVRRWEEGAIGQCGWRGRGLVRGRLGAGEEVGWIRGWGGAGEKLCQINGRALRWVGGRITLVYSCVPELSLVVALPAGANRHAPRDAGSRTTRSVILSWTWTLGNSTWNALWRISEYHLLGIKDMIRYWMF